jgi:hypothetical protein
MMRPTTAITNRRKAFGWLRPETDPEVQNWKQVIHEIETKEPPESEIPPEHEDKKSKKKKKKGADDEGGKQAPEVDITADPKHPLNNWELMQPLLEVATLLQDNNRWEESGECVPADCSRRDCVFVCSLSHLRRPHHADKLVQLRFGLKFPPVTYFIGEHARAEAMDAVFWLQSMSNSTFFTDTRLTRCAESSRLRVHQRMHCDCYSKNLLLWQLPFHHANHSCKLCKLLHIDLCVIFCASVCTRCAGS